MPGNEKNPVQIKMSYVEPGILQISHQL